MNTAIETDKQKQKILKAIVMTNLNELGIMRKLQIVTPKIN